MDDELEEIRQRKRAEIENRSSAEEANVPTDPVHVDSPSHLDQITNEYDVVLVDFYADWCGPCKMLEPIVGNIARNTDAVVAKVDIDQHQMLAQQNGVRGVPTLALYSDGEMVKRMVGVQDESTLTNLVEQFA
ncbi:thioredoxin [Haladaptatus sp. NG-WS-4]